MHPAVCASAYNGVIMKRSDDARRGRGQQSRSSSNRFFEDTQGYRKISCSHVARKIVLDRTVYMCLYTARITVIWRWHVRAQHSREINSADESNAGKEERGGGETTLIPGRR